MMEALAGPDSTKYIFKSSELPYYLDADCSGSRLMVESRNPGVSGVSEVVEKVPSEPGKCNFSS